MCHLWGGGLLIGSVLNKLPVRLIHDIVHYLVDWLDYQRNRCETDGRRYTFADGFIRLGHFQQSTRSPADPIDGESRNYHRCQHLPEEHISCCYRGVLKATTECGRSLE